MCGWTVPAKLGQASKAAEQSTPLRAKSGVRMTNFSRVTLFVLSLLLLVDRRVSPESAPSHFYAMENQATEMDKEAATDRQPAEGKPAVIRGALPKSIVESITLPYNPIIMPFRETVYQALSVERRDIRLLEIPFSSVVEPISCNLVKFSLNESPEYAVLSDAAVDTGKIGHLVLNSHRISTKWSVISAIRQFNAAARDSGYSGHGKAVRLWASALCINQANLSERSSQDQLHGEIYTNAKVVWTGSDNPKDTVLARGVGREKVKEVGSIAKVRKGTVLARGVGPEKVKEVGSMAKVRKDTALARGVGPEKMKEVGSMAEIQKDTALASTATTRVGLTMRAGGSLWLLNANLRVEVRPAPVAEESTAASQLASKGHRSQTCTTCHDLCLDHCLDYDSERLKTSLRDIEGSAEQGCPSCALLRDGIALCEVDFRTSETPTRRQLTDLCGYSLLQRTGYTAFPGDETQSDASETFGYNDRVINAAHGRGCGLCITYIYRNGPKDRLGTAVDLDYFTEQGMLTNFKHRLTYTNKYIAVNTGATNPCPWQSIRVSTAISGDTSSEQSFSRALAWLQKCHQDHKTCGDLRTGPLPDRVLDLGSGGFNENRAVKLYETRNELASYTCLSHRWGNPQPLTTSSDTLEDRKAGIPWDALPRTFQDAITFTRRLKIQYLWIDSLCIIQNDVGDWQRQSSKMPSIYENSYLTLAATWSDTSTGGCFSQASSAYRARELTVADRRGNSHKIFVRRHLPHWLMADPRYGLPDLTGEFPILGRAWVLQERLLSPRILHFGRHELIWECIERAACECSFLDHLEDKYHDKLTHHENMLRVGNGLLQPLERDSVQQAGGGQCWRTLVTRYSKMGLTYETDKLPALSGLAKQMNRVTKDTYVAGLWKSSLPIDLLWKVDIPQDPLPQWRAPSWSWASVKSSAYYGNELADTCEPRQHLRILVATQVPVGENDMGEISAAFLVVSAQLCPADLVVYTPRVGATLTEHDLFVDNHRLYSGLNSYAAPGLFGAQEFEVKLDTLLPPTTRCRDFSDCSYERSSRKVFLMRVAELSHYEHSLILSCIDPVKNLYERIGIVSEHKSRGPRANQIQLPWADQAKCLTSTITLV